VRLGRFDRDRSITFIPPDGLFEVMTYRVSQNINLPFKITPVIQEFNEEGRIEFSINVKSIFEHSNYANNVVIKIPVPSNTADVKIFSAGTGKAKYEPEKSAIFWRIKKF
jgi:AP-2 complex subunit mu-1